MHIPDPLSVAFGDGAVAELRHNNLPEQRWLFAVIGAYFASAPLRAALGRPLTSDDNYTWLVWHAGGEPRAFAAVSAVAGGAAELRHAYTLAPWRRQGFNGWSIPVRIEIARARGARYVTTVLQPNRVERYTALGFRPFGARGQYQVLRKDL